MTIDNDTEKRKYYLDWIKVCVVLILVPFHTAVSFSHIGHAYNYTEEVVNSFLFIFISDYFNLWFMRMLFFISGISVFLALKKRSKKQFIKNRFRRLMVPVIFVVFTIGPLSGYILAIQHYSYVGSFISFYPQFFLHVTQYLFWGHMWYCVYLFAYSIVTLPLFFYLKRNIDVVDQLNLFLEKKNHILLPMLIIAAFEMLFRPFYPGLQTLIGDWANFFVYLSFFIFGFVMGQSSSLMHVISKKMMIFFISAVASTIIYFYIKRFSNFSLESYKIKALLSSLWGIAAYSWVFFYLAFFKRYVNKSNRLLSYLSKTSFHLYVFHYFILSIILFFMFQTEMNYYMIWLTTTVLTYLVFIFMYELVNRCNKYIRKFTD